MKKLKYLAIIGAMLVSANGYSQGVIIFANNAQTLVVNSLTGNPAATGVLRVGLYYNVELSALPDLGVADDSFTQSGAFAPVGGLLGAGRYSGGNREVPTTGEVLVQVRAWSAAFATYEEAFNAGLAGTPGVLVGASNLMRGTGGVPPTGAPTPLTGAPPNGFGLQGFSVSVVPEPSMIALSILGGLGAMALLRRRK